MKRVKLTLRFTRLMVFTNLGKSNIVYLVISGLAAGLCAVVVYANFLIVLNGKYIQIGNLIFYSFLVVFFSIRLKPRYVSSNGKHYIYALAGTFSPFLLQIEKDVDSIYYVISFPVILVGMIVTIISLLYLGRSFGVIAARRQIKTMGPYRHIRHPMYAGEAIWFLSAVIYNISIFNIFVYILHLMLQIKRMDEEEKILGQDESYSVYLKNVRYRLIPGIY